MACARILSFLYWEAKSWTCYCICALTDQWQEKIYFPEPSGYSQTAGWPSLNTADSYSLSIRSSKSFLQKTAEAFLSVILNPVTAIWGYFIPDARLCTCFCWASWHSCQSFSLASQNPSNYQPCSARWPFTLLQNVYKTAERALYAIIQVANKDIKWYCP